MEFLEWATFLEHSRRNFADQMITGRAISPNLCTMTFGTPKVQLDYIKNIIFVCNWYWHVMRFGNIKSVTHSHIPWLPTMYPNSRYHGYTHFLQGWWKHKVITWHTTWLLKEKETSRNVERNFTPYLTYLQPVLDLRVVWTVFFNLPSTFTTRSAI